MNIFPAIDLYDKKAVRLYKGNYNEMTIYSENPELIAKDFVKQGAKFIHIVDLNGARDGSNKNFDMVSKIKKESGVFCEIGGGIRSMEAIEKYINAKVDRVILGTIAVLDENFVKDAVLKYGDKIAVGVDILDGLVAIKGWVEKSKFTAFELCEKMQKIGVKTMICTDISKDGAMQGTNIKLYKELSDRFNMQIIASGGVSTIDDVINLSKMNLYGAIIGKAYYEKAIDLRDAIEVSK